MGNISNLLHQALVTWLNRRDIAAVEVSYRTAEGTGMYEYRGDMGELIRELDDVS